MKKWKRALLAGVAACAAMTVSAAASSFDSTADALKTMDLFAGTNNGYELDRAPTRAEAATMLVRLLGKTEEAERLWESQKADFVFADMNGNFEWAKPYVNWLERNDLAAGTSATKFSPGTTCSAQMYAAFLMRTLGYYEVNGDFAFADALDFARMKGVINDVNCDTAKFLRDHVVAASYTALSVQPRSGESDLLTKLVSSGAVSASAAAAEQQKFAAYRAYAEAVDGVSDGAAMQNVTTVSVSGGLSMELTSVADTRVKGERLSMEGTMTMTVPGMSPYTLTRTGYYAGGRWYTEENGVKGWRKATLDSVLREVSQPEAVPIVLLDQIRATGSGYSLTYSDAGREACLTDLKLIESALGAGVTGMKDLTISGLTAEVQTSNGVLTGLTTGVTVSGRMNNLTAGGGETSVTIRAQQTSSVTATGSGVSVNVPDDLASYPERS